MRREKRREVKGERLRAVIELWVSSKRHRSTVETLSEEREEENRL